MPNLLYASRSKVSMVTATKKTLWLVNGAFKERRLDYKIKKNVVYAQCCLCYDILNKAYFDYCMNLHGMFFGNYTETICVALI